MQGEPAIQVHGAKRSARSRDRDARTKVVVPLLEDRDHDVQRIGCTALKNATRTLRVPFAAPAARTSQEGATPNAPIAMPVW